MSDYVRQSNPQPNDVIASADWNNEFNAAQVAINSKPDADLTKQDSLVTHYAAEKDDETLHEVSKDGGDGNNGEAAIPICNGTLQTNLNAEKLGGLTSGEISSAAFEVGTRMLFFQNEAPDGWTEVVINTLANRDPVIMVGRGHETGSDGTATQSPYTLGVGDIPNFGVNTMYQWGMSRFLLDNDRILSGSTDSDIMDGSDVPQHTHQYDAFRFAVPGAGNNILGTGETNKIVITAGINSGANSGPVSYSHDHTLEGELDAGWRPPHLYCIIAERS